MVPDGGVYASCVHPADTFSGVLYCRGRDGSDRVTVPGDPGIAIGP